MPLDVLWAFLKFCLLYDVLLDTAMNASFTIGCLCGSEQSRCLILAEAKEQKLVREQYFLPLDIAKEYMLMLMSGSEK